MSMARDITGILMIKKASMEKIANNPGSTIIAFILIIVSALFASVSDIYLYLTATSVPSSSPFATLSDYKANLLTTAFVVLVFYLFFVFILAGVMGFVLRGFGGTATRIQCLRVIGFAELFNIIGSLVKILLTLLGQSTVGGYIGLLFFALTLIAFIIGLTSFSRVSAGIAIVAVILASVLAGVLSSFLSFIIVFQYIIT